MDYELGLDTPLEKPILYLCKPNREVIAILDESYEISREVKLGSISELSFKIPIKIDIKHKLKENPNLHLIKERYLIKFEYHNESEWFVITSPTDVFDEDADYKEVECFGLPYQLADKHIKDLNAISYNATAILQAALTPTVWTVGYVDAEFDLKYRDFDVSSTTVLDLIFDIAETFNALPVFNSENRTVSLYKGIGQDKGLTVGLGNLMKSGNVKKSTDEFCTRLKVFGKDGIDISAVNPTGANYIENYAPFIYPFERDVARNVITHSDFMSDDLCHALLDYFELVESNRGAFENYVSQKTNKQATLISQQNTLTTLETELDVLEDQIQVANLNGQSTSVLITQRNAKRVQINNQNTLISATTGEISAIDSSILALKNTLSVENNFTPSEISEWIEHFIIEKEVIFEHVNDDQQLYDLAVEKFREIQSPIIIAEISIVNLFEIAEEQHNRDRLMLGDIITVEDERFHLNLQVRLLGIKYDYENGEINLTLSNAKEILDDYEVFKKGYGNVVSTSTTVNANKYKWMEANELSNEIYQDIQNDFNAVSRKIKASIDNSVIVDRRGITVVSPSEPNDLIRITSGVIALSNDSGDSWNVAIDTEKILAERIKGVIGEFAQLRANQIILGQSGEQLGDALIQSSTAWNTAAMQAANSVQLGESYSNTVITASSGIVSTRTDNLSRSIMSGSGFAVQKNVGGTWTNKFYADSNGDLNVDGIIRAQDVIIGGTSILQSNKIKGSVIEASTLYVNAANITGTLIAHQIVANASITAPTITGGTINGTNITTTQDITVGRNITMGTSGTKTITFAGSGNITFYDGSYALIANSSRIELATSSLTWSGNTVATNSQIVGLQSQISDLWVALANKSNVGHTHAVSIPHHNHGNPENVNSGGGTFVTSS